MNDANDTNPEGEAVGYVSGAEGAGRALVVVFLRGAADGLTLVPPLEDDDYFRARPRLSVPKKDALKLDGRFGLNPLLKPMPEIYEEGRLAIIHGIGSEDQTRSHFEAQDLMEHGGMVGGGWLGRFLRFRNPPAEGALAAIAIGRALPESLRGAPTATVMQTLEDFRFGRADASPLLAGIERLYAMEGGDLGAAGRDTLKALRRIEELRSKPYRPADGAAYPEGEFGNGLTQIARLIKAGVGLQAATIDLSGWDSHFAQNTLIEPLMTRLGQGLGAFRTDLGRDLDRVSVVVMTEFGRRVAENSAFGTDHGRGGVMFVMGGGVRGGRILADWKGLASDTLEGPGDVPVTINYRDALAPILARHGAGDLGNVFPGHQVKALDL